MPLNKETKSNLSIYSQIYHPSMGEIVPQLFFFKFGFGIK